MGKNMGDLDPGTKIIVAMWAGYRGVKGCRSPHEDITGHDDCRGRPNVAHRGRGRAKWNREACSGWVHIDVTHIRIDDRQGGKCF